MIIFFLLLTSIFLTGVVWGIFIWSQTIEDLVKLNNGLRDDNIMKIIDSLKRMEKKLK